MFFNLLSQKLIIKFNVKKIVDILVEQPQEIVQNHKAHKSQVIFLLEWNLKINSSSRTSRGENGLF